MKKYSSYKPSGEEYIGDIPTNWECYRLGMLGVFSSSGIDKKTMENESIVRMVNYTDIIQSRKYIPIQTGEKEYMVVSTPKSKLEEHRLFRGDMVFIPSSETKDDLGYSSLIDFEENDVVYSYHILRFRTSKEIYHYFKKYLINHHSVLSQFSRESKGTTRQIIGRNVFNNVKVVLPTIQEQEQIVKYLDEKTSIIDKLISTKERKIDLLKEQRSSLINEVITKGLDPNVKMKDSGVEWIGEIPEHWRKTRIKRYCEVKDGTHDTPQYLDGIENTIPLVTSNSFNNGEIDFSLSKRISVEDYIEINRRSNVEKDDIIMSMIGSNIGNRVLVKTDDPFSIKNVCLFKTSKSQNLTPKYLLYLIDSKYLKYQVDFSQKGGGQPFLSLDELRNLLFPFPPYKEQQEIVGCLDKHTKEIDDLVSMEQNKIELLKEYRQSLISEVITGKIKVVE
jgi:type I restriction enzyme S subunit